MNSMNRRDNDEEEGFGGDMGVEVIGIPRKKKKRREGATAPAPASCTEGSSGSGSRSYMSLPKMEANDHLVEISLQEVVPPTTPRERRVRVKYPAGTMLPPPPHTSRIATAASRGLQKLKRWRSADRSLNITHVDGDPFPPSFRVVGVSPAPQTRKKQELLQKPPLSPPVTTTTTTPRGELAVKRLPVPVANNVSSSFHHTNSSNDSSFLLNQTTSTALTVEEDFYRSTKNQYMQLDLPPQPELFQDEEEQTAPTTTNTGSTAKVDASFQPKTTTRNYRHLTKQLLQPRKERKKRERQQQKSLTAKELSTILQSKDWTRWGCLCLGVIMMATVTGLLVAILKVRQDSRKQQHTACAAVVQSSTNNGGTKTPPPITTPPPSPAPTTALPTATPHLLPQDFPEATQVILAEANPNNPQVLAYEWLIQDPNVAQYPAWRQFQRYALATLYYSTNGEQWNCHEDSWLTLEDECQWFPQACNENGRVTRLLLAASSLEGKLPPDIFLCLPALQQLQLQNNPNLRGSLPTEIGLMANLQVLWIQGCALTMLPSELGLLQSLLYLDASSSRPRRNGTKIVPTELGRLTNLQELLLSHAGLVSTIPSEFGNLGQLQHLNVEGNALEGRLPSDLGRAIKLERFLAAENLLSGSLSVEWTALTGLEILDVSVNHLSGSLPSEFGTTLTNLEEVWLYDNLLTGVLPTEWGQLVSLASLDLSMNHLQGMVPSELGSLSTVTGLWLYKNDFRGTIPRQLGNLEAALLQLSLFGNELTGSIPRQLHQLTKLRGLWLDDNKISGTIPAELLTSTLLISLHLFRNRLRGSLPRSFPANSYYAFQEIRLEQNLLTGTLPTSLGNLHLNLERLNLHQNEFSGTIPTQMARLTNLVLLSLQRNELSGFVPRDLCAVKQSANELLSISVDCQEVLCDCGCACS